MIEMSMWAFRDLSSQEFSLCFQIFSFRSIDLNEDPKRCFNAFTVNLRSMWVLSMPISLGLSGCFVCNKVCQAIEFPSIEVVKLT